MSVRYDTGPGSNHSSVRIRKVYLLTKENLIHGGFKTEGNYSYCAG